MELLEDDSATDRYKINVLDRAVRILKAFNAGTSHMSLQQITASTRLPKSTVFRILSALSEHGLIMRDTDSGDFALGYEILMLAEVARESSGLAGWAMPIITEISDRLQETVVINVRSGDFRIPTVQVIGKQSTRRSASIGQPKPLYAGAAGKVFLAGMSDHELDDYLGRTELVKVGHHTITDADLLRQEIEEIRRIGYAVGVGEIGESEIAGVSAAIQGRMGVTVGALTITVPAERFDPELRGRLIDAVVGGAERVGANLRRHRTGK